MSKVNNYNLQYWLYAILNKSFGPNVNLIRDTLHARYSVNRHGFTVQGPALNAVKSLLIGKLEEAGFAARMNNTLMKALPDRTIFVSINTGKDFMGREHLYVIGSVYKK